MSVDILRPIVRDILTLLARGDYDALVSRCSKSRLTTDELRAVLREFGQKPRLPPLDFNKEIDAVQVKNAAVPTWSVRVPVWTEKGRSDLTIDLTIALGLGAPTVELDDLHVL